MLFGWVYELLVLQELEVLTDPLPRRRGLNDLVHETALRCDHRVRKFVRILRRAKRLLLLGLTSENNLHRARGGSSLCGRNVQQSSRRLPTTE